MGLKLLFICTGNTCRSPIAEGLAGKMFGDSIQVSSAGIEAYAGEGASIYALEVLKEQDVDISGHRSRRIKAELIADADWIIPMTQAQEKVLMRLFPQYIHKIHCLGDWGNSKMDVNDPWGGSFDDYRQTADEIGKLLNTLKDKLL